MTKIFCGTSDLPHDRRTFYQTASAIEYRVGLFSPPKARVLKEWGAAAAGATQTMRSVWVAWQAFTHRAADIQKGHGLKLLEGEVSSHLGHFLRTDENLRVWTHIKEQAVHVGAQRILLETPANFTPSQANQAALTDFVREWADVPEGMKLVWHPAGFWERDEAAKLAAALDIVLAIDPLVDENEALPDGPEAYFQMLGRHGLMDDYSDDDLERILEMTASYDEVTIIFRTYHALRDAQRLIKRAADFEPDDFDFDSPDEIEDEDRDME